MTYPLGRSRWQVWVLSGLWAVAVLLVAAWVLASQLTGWRQLTGIAAVICVGLVVYQGWKNSPVGQLAWDGQVWRWEGPGYQAGIAEYKLLRALDFQNVMLLRIENQAMPSCGFGPSGGHFQRAGLICAARFIHRTVSSRVWPGHHERSTHRAIRDQSD